MMRDNSIFILVGLYLVALFGDQSIADELVPVTDHGGPELNAEGPVKAPIRTPASATNG